MKTPENTSMINVCVIPDSAVGDACIQLSQSLGSDATMFRLGDGKFAHMTVYMARFSNDVLDQVAENVKKVLASITAFPCIHTGYFMTAGRYLEASYQKSDNFMNLHEAIISAVSDLRYQPGNPFEEGFFTPYTAEQQQNAKETGYDLARNLYRPHITLTRYKQGMVPEALPVFPEVKLSFDLATVAVYKADENGAIYEEIATFTI